MILYFGKQKNIKKNFKIMAEKKKKSTKKNGAKKRKAVKANLKPVDPKSTVIAVSLVLVISVIISAVVIFTDTERVVKKYPYEFEKSVSQGIDVSEHNDTIDWTLLEGNIDFAFIRVAYRGYESGELHIDSNYEENIAGCEKAGIPYGVYVYSQAVSEEEAVEEADCLIKAMKHHNPDLPLVMDFEYGINRYGNETGRLYEKHFDQKEATSIVRAFCDRVEDKGYTPGIYASSSVIAHKLNQKKLSKSTVIWVADYTGEVSYDVDYTIWQYSRTESIDGVPSKYVDMNYWYQD